MRYAFVAAFCGILLSAPALANEQKNLPEFVTFGGYGFAWQANWRDRDESKRGPIVVYDVVSAWSGNVAKADCARFKSELRGATWCFSTEENKKAFDGKTKDGDNELLPSFGGRCALGVSWGMLTPRGHPESARVITDTFGDPILVMHSNIKWWWQFKEEDFKRALLAYNIAKGPRIVPNEQLK